MKKSFVRIAGAAALLTSMLGLAGAQGLPGSGWYTTTTIQNISTNATAATVTLDVYPQQGSASNQVSSATFQLAKDANKVFVPGGNNAFGTVDVSPSLGANFSGSMVANSTEPVVAIGQVSNNRPPAFPTLGTTGGQASAFYRGSESSSSTLIYPVVKSNFGGKTTLYSVQAAGGAVSSFTATITDGAGATHTKTGNIAENRSVLLLPSDFTPPMATTNCQVGATLDPNNSPCFGSLKVVATGANIVGAYVEFQTGQSPATLVQSAAMFGVSEAASTVSCPTIKNAYTAAQGRFTGLTVANTSGAAVTINAVFTAAPPSATAGTKYPINGVTIAANKSHTFSQFGTGNAGLGGMPTNTLASAEVTVVGGAKSIVAVVNESNLASQNGVTRPVKATTYTCFNKDTATQRVAAPLVKKNRAGSTSGPTVQNANPSGGASFKVKATYVCDNGTFGPFENAGAALAPGGSYTFFNPAEVAGTPLCAVTLDAGTGNKIFAIVQETSDFAGTAAERQLDTKNYEGFNIP